DFCIVGTGAGGGVLAQRLARFGFSVVALEAGEWHDSERDMVSDEAGSQRLYWNDLRITGGTDPLELGANNSGRGVGGGTARCTTRRSARGCTHPIFGWAATTGWRWTGR